MIGEGIQQIPNYKCPLAVDKLTELREEFWNSRSSKRHIWKIIREACTSDAATAAILLECGGLACNGNLREVFELERPDYIYRVPNYCIIDPIFDRDYKSKENESKFIKDEKIKVLINCVNNQNLYSFKCSNKTKVDDLKQMLADEMKINRDKYNIRLVFGGLELSDEHLLCFHSIENNTKIQALYTKI